MNVAEPMVTSAWASLSNWFTPAVLFCVLNLMIGTIFIISSLKPHKKQKEVGSEDASQPQLVRAPSLLERVKSFNLSLHRSEQPYPAQYAVPRDREDQNQKVEEAEVRTEDLVESRVEAPAKVPSRKMKKSVSQKAVVLEKEKEAEVVDLRRPVTVKERKGRWSESLQIWEDEAVDEKADDFINRFRQQLKLQRLDSIRKYKELLNRGAGR